MSGSEDGGMSPATVHVKDEPKWDLLDERSSAAEAGDEADLDVKSEVKWEVEIAPEPLQPLQLQDIAPKPQQPLQPQDIALDAKNSQTQQKCDDDKPRALTTKYCFVKGCLNNSKRAPQKQFFSVPSGNAAEWCRAAGRETIPKKRQLICDDHLNLEDDMENYTFWRMMSDKGGVKVRLKSRLPASMRKGT